MRPGIIEFLAAAFFAAAIVQAFLTGIFEHLARRYPAHGGILRLLGEVELAFGLWALALVIVLLVLQGGTAAAAYVGSRHFTEPLFVLAIMIVAGSRPIFELAGMIVRGFASLLPLPGARAGYFTILFLVPLLGSFITEPAAMTLGALMLRDRHFARDGLDARFQYASLGVLLVNVSIGGVLTSFAAPPVLMVASTWGWDSLFMLGNFGWKAALAVFVNAAAVTMLFRDSLASGASDERVRNASPAPLILANAALLSGIVVFAQHPPMFLGLLLGVFVLAAVWPQQQGRLILREAALVAVFLAGLVILGGLQQWWLQPLLTSMSADQIYFGATALTAVTDNAALTYLGSQVTGLSEEFKYMLVAGAVTGGGLTVIANAPNPAAFSILKSRFEGGSIGPLRLLLAALPPTLVAIGALRYL